jgi:hypothetical protein
MTTAASRIRIDIYVEEHHCCCRPKQDMRRQQVPDFCVCERTLHNQNEIIFLQVLAADDQGTQFVDASWVWLLYRAYYIRVPIGKQAANYKLLVDTGSDTTWLFCQFVHDGNDGYAEPQPQISIKSLHPHPHPHHLSAFSAYPFLHML